MDQEKYIALLHKQQQGTIDAMEQSLLDNWLQQADINKVLAKKIKEDWDLTTAYEPPIVFDIEEEFTALQQRIQIDQKTTSKQAVAKVVPIKRNRNWLSWAAAIALVVGVSTWFLGNQSTNVLQLTSTTVTSEKKEVKLADGTKVWLNEKSKLSYPETFDKNQRVVQLEGEAFFDVQKNPAQPFIIETKVILLPNEKGIHQHANKIVQKTKSTELNELAWHQKVLLFKGTPIPEVLNHLERTFNIDIQANTNALSQCTFSGRFPEPNPDQLLKAICNEFDIDLKKVNDGVYELSGGKCR